MNNFLLYVSYLLSPPPTWSKKISIQCKVALVSTFVIGLIAHLFCYTNIFPFHDNSGLYWDAYSFADGASGSRWLAPIWLGMVGNMLLPWLEGVLTLLFFGISAYLVCEVLSIQNNILVILVSGLLVTSPTAISSNMYLSSAHTYAGALMFASLSVYAFEKLRHGWLWSLLALIICAGTYGAYIDFAVALFLLVQIVQIIFRKDLRQKQAFIHHLVFLLISVLSMVFTSLIVSLILRNSDVQAQQRVSNATSGDIYYYLEGIQQAVQDVINYFSPYAHISYLQNIPILYALLVIVTAMTVILLLWAAIRNCLWKRPLSVIILLVDLLCLPLAMNLIGMFYHSHTLMRFAYILPWLCFLQIVQLLTDDASWKDTASGRPKQALYISAYTLLVMLLSVVSITSEILVANAAYSKAYALHESGISLVNRIVDRIESTPGYIAGETKVLFVGDLQESYYFRDDGYDIADSITGISLKTALTYNLVLTNYIQQHLGIHMNILTTYDWIQSDSRSLRQLLSEDCGVPWAEDAPQIIDQLDTFPSSNCIYLRDGVLLIRFS